LICHDLNVLLFQINLSYILRSWKVKLLRLRMKFKRKLLRIS
jgi:hypothetical protein